MKKIIPFLILSLSCFAVEDRGRDRDREKEEFKEAISLDHNYFFPGTIGYQQGRWVGSDHLFNLPKNINVVVQLLAPTVMELDYTDKMIEARVKDFLEKSGMGTEISEAPPLPFLHVMIFQYPVDGKGTATYVGLRLFENVELPRVVLDEEIYFQAITWERETMLVTPPEQAKDLLMKTIDTFINDFIEKREKSELQKVFEDRKN